MKKIIPFTKDIEFNTTIFEINSISLEHNLKLENKNEIKGEFIISGDYKESDSKVNNEPFIFNIPYNIDLDEKYSLDDTKIDIDNFDYELINEQVLKVNISISLDATIKEDNIKMTDDNVIDIIDEDIKEDERGMDDLFKEEEIIVPIIKDESDNQEKDVTSIFENFSKDDEKYITYHVHIYREKDDINEIIKMYNTTKEDLEEYNDLSKITLGSKIIIPSYEQI